MSVARETLPPGHRRCNQGIPAATLWLSRMKLLPKLDFSASSKLGMPYISMFVAPSSMRTSLVVEKRLRARSVAFGKLIKHHRNNGVQSDAPKNVAYWWPDGLWRKSIGLQSGYRSHHYAS